MIKDLILSIKFPVSSIVNTKTKLPFFFYFTPVILYTLILLPTSASFFLKKKLSKNIKSILFRF